MKRPGELVRAAGILLMRDAEQPREFLLLRHPHRWDLPKGHCEGGESWRDAALRETEEETGIDPRWITLDTEFAFDLTYPVTYKRHGDQVFQKQVRYFLGYLPQRPALKLTEHEAAQWFPWSPPHRIQPQTIDPLLERVAAYLSGRAQSNGSRPG